MVKEFKKQFCGNLSFFAHIRLHRKSIYLPTAWYLAPERNPDDVSRLLQSKSSDLTAKSTQKPGGFDSPQTPTNEQGTPLHPRHLAVCRQFKRNHDIFMVYFGKSKAFAKALN